MALKRRSRPAPFGRGDKLQLLAAEVLAQAGGLGAARAYGRDPGARRGARAFGARRRLEKYAADARALVRLVRDEIASVSPAGGCVVLRTRHDMLGSEDPTRNARRVGKRADARAINAVIETIGEELNVPVFPWARIFNERLEENVFDGWCHQWGDASVYMQRRFNSWAKTHLPSECLAGTDGHSAGS